MRKALLGLSVITAVGTTLVAGGAFSIFNDSGEATGTFASGTVELSLGTNTFVLTGDCTTTFTDAANPDADQNMGSVNNNACTTTIPVSNAGTLPMVISASDLTDVISGGAPTTVTCFSSEFTAGDLVGALNPGESRNVRVVTTVDTSNDCQDKTDQVTATFTVEESLPAA